MRGRKALAGEAPAVILVPLADRISNISASGHHHRQRLVFGGARGGMPRLLRAW